MHKFSFLIFALGLSVACASLHDEFQALEIIPVESQLPRQQQFESFPRMSPKLLARIPMQVLANCESGMSPKCKEIFDKIAAQSPVDEDYAYGQGAYDEYADIDENADIGVLNMPYQMDYDLLKSHLISISGVEPCGGCSDSS